MSRLKSKKVFLIGPDSNQYGYSDMFIRFGWQPTDEMWKADLFQFTGGEDVTPFLYGEYKHPQTINSVKRDLEELMLFNLATFGAIPMAGICRGGQFLNVMCGGRMWQHVDRHGLAGTHSAIDAITGETFPVTSTHHQMMLPDVSAQVFLKAKESTFKERCNKLRDEDKQKDLLTDDVLKFTSFVDVEGCYYEKYNVLCFQPHPEYRGYDELAARYFEYLESYLQV